MSNIQDVIVSFCLELEREKEERKDAELSVAAFKRQLVSLGDKIATLDVDIQHYRALTQNLRRGTSMFFVSDPVYIFTLSTQKRTKKGLLLAHLHPMCHHKHKAARNSLPAR